MSRSEWFGFTGQAMAAAIIKELVGARQSLARIGSSTVAEATRFCNNARVIDIDNQLIAALSRFKTARLTAAQTAACQIIAIIRRFQQAGGNVADLTDNQIIVLARGDLTVARSSI
jgi:hypothetical protein